MAFEFDLEKAAASPWVASAVGALLGARVVPGENWFQRLCNAAVMFLVGVVAGGGVVEYLSISKGRVAALVVLLTAAAGVVVFQAAIAAIKTTNTGALLDEWLRKVLGLNKEAQP